MEDRKLAIKAAERAWAAQNGRNASSTSGTMGVDDRASPITVSQNGSTLVPSSTPVRPKTADPAISPTRRSSSSYHLGEVKKEERDSRPSDSKIEENNFIGGPGHLFTTKLSKEMNMSPPRANSSNTSADQSSSHPLSMSAFHSSSLRSSPPLENPLNSSAKR